MMDKLFSLIMVIFSQCMYQNIKLYTLSIYNFTCQRYLNKVVRKTSDYNRGVWSWNLILPPTPEPCSDAEIIILIQEQ